MLGQALDAVATFLERSVVRRTLDAYCDLVTTAGEHEFVAKDGSIVTLLRMEGARSMTGDADLGVRAQALRVGWSGYFGQAGHTLQFWFAHSPSLAQNEVERSLDGMRGVAKDVGLDVEDILQERRSLLPRRMAGERAYLVLWSRPGLLQKGEAEDARRRLRATFESAPSGRDGQMPGLGAEALLVRHRSVCEALTRELADAGVVTERLSTHAAMTAMKVAMNPAFGPLERSWCAALPGNAIRARMADQPDEVAGLDVSNVLWPLIARQLMSEHAEVLSQTEVRLGDYVWSAFDVSLPPELLVSFNGLVRRVLEGDERLAWRMSMVIDSGGFHGQVFKEQIARAAHWATVTTNQRVRDAFIALRHADGAGDTVVRWRASFAVWAHVNDRDRLTHHAARLRRAVERWGNAQTDSLIGDPVEAVMSSALGFSPASTAPAASASLTDVLAMAPIARPASPWRDGAMTFRTDDGKAWRFQPGSSQQLSWVDLMVGTPGSGKSVLLNSLNLAVALSPQSARSARDGGALPRIAIIDVGRSSEGLIQLLRDSLPVERRHEAVFHRLRMDKRFAVNPFDTQLGLRFPLAYERGYLVNLVSLICTPERETKPYDGITDLAAAAVDALYTHFSDRHSPRRYVPGDQRIVDEAIERHRLEIDDATTWWELTDRLAHAGHLHEAVLAQRQAVPTLPDLVRIVTQENVSEPFQGMLTPLNEALVRSFQRMVTAAARDYPILAEATRFDVANARVVAFDLADVAAKVGPQAQKQTAIMYMMARHAITTDYWLDPDELRGLGCDPRHRDQLVAVAEASRQSPKRLCFDEYHLTGGLGIRDQVIQDVRVGRKAGVQLALASQLIEDFDEAIQDLASNVWFCNVPTKGALEAISARYAFSDTVREAMQRLNGPEPGVGAPVVAMMKLKSGTYVQRVVNELGPVELWALSTTAEDVALRTRLHERLGPKEARRRLARRFPTGTAKAHVERLLAALEDRAVVVSDRERGNVIETLADDIVKGTF